MAGDRRVEAGRLAQGRPSGGGESVGHESGRKIINLLRRKRGDLSEGDYKHMRKVVGYVRRHMAQRPSGNVRDTKWRWSLMNWGHDPLSSPARRSHVTPQDTAQLRRSWCLRTPRPSTFPKVAQILGRAAHGSGRGVAWRGGLAIRRRRHGAHDVDLATRRSRRRRSSADLEFRALPPPEQDRRARPAQGSSLTARSGSGCPGTPNRDRPGTTPEPTATKGQWSAASQSRPTPTETSSGTSSG